MSGCQFFLSFCQCLFRCFHSAPALSCFTIFGALFDFFAHGFFCRPRFLQFLLSGCQFFLSFCQCLFRRFHSAPALFCFAVFWALFDFFTHGFFCRPRFLQFLLGGCQFLFCPFQRVFSGFTDSFLLSPDRAFTGAPFLNGPLQLIALLLLP